MKPRPALPAGPYLVVGLARSGAAAVEMLRSHGEVMGCDSGEPPQASALEGVEIELRSDGLELLERARTVVKNPGVPQAAPVIAAARERGLEVTGELELAWRLAPNEIVAVTGTNGKTTTTELLGAIHRAAGIEVAVAGNVGTPLSAFAGGRLGREAVVVCECSSFQLEDCSQFSPECAVLLNLEEDHLDRHGTLAAYRAAKRSIFAHQGANDVAVAPPALAPSGPARVVSFDGGDADLSLREGRLLWHGDVLLETDELRLRGAHNLENAMAAAAAALARGVEPAAVSAALRTFAGVPHRLEQVGERDGVLYVNDSKATNVAAARMGIEAFAGGVHAIVGGSLKGGGFAALRPAVAARCQAAYLIGEAAPALATELAGAAPLHVCGDLERALAAASEAARAGEVVLLSPACASFDQYRDFEQRGEHFRALFAALQGHE